MSVTVNNEKTECTRRLSGWSQIGGLHRIRNSADSGEFYPIYQLDIANERACQRPRRYHIGRNSTQNTVVISDKLISRQHAVLVQEGTELYLRDNYSTLGTYLNGHELSSGDEFLIRHKDLIGFGPLLFEYRQEVCVDQYEMITDESDRSVNSNEVAERSRQRQPQQSNLLAAIVAHNTKVQFFGYTLGNVLLATQKTLTGSAAIYGLNAETLATIVLLLASICAWHYSPQKRPYMLLYNGAFLFLGGLLFVIAGYHFTGMTMLAASFETMRGGFLKLKALNANHVAQGGRLTAHARYAEQWGTYTLKLYMVFIQQISVQFHKAGRFLDKRPFLLSPAIQMPARVTFLQAMILAGNWIGVLVGLLWLLGDFGLALNDSKLKLIVMRRIVQSPTVTHARELVLEPN